MSPAESLKRAIVVTDDGDLVRRQISSLLKKAGFEILTAMDGPFQPVDLLVIDTAVLKKDSSAIRARFQHISSRVLFLSDGESENLADMVRGRVFRILAKPFRRSQLLGHVLEIMDQSPSGCSACSA